MPSPTPHFGSPRDGPPGGGGDLGREMARQRQEQMIQRQIVGRGIEDERVLEALRRVPRELFTPEGVDPFADAAGPIDCGQTISQPYIVALMTHHLHVRETDRVLEIGTGSGYQAAVLAMMAADVYTVERHQPLLLQAQERFEAMNVGNVHLRHGDGTRGWPEFAPYDRILITAAAPQIPETLLRQQLAEDGLAVLPVGSREEQSLVLVRRHGQKLQGVDICPVRFVPLIGEEGWMQ